MIALPHEADTPEDLDAWTTHIAENGHAIAAVFDPAPPAASTEQGVIVWQRDLIVATAMHVANGPEGNRSRLSNLDGEGLPLTHPQHARFWASILDDGLELEARGSLAATSIKPSPELAAAWRWIGKWWKDTYLPAHPDIDLLDAMTDICESALCASWTSDAPYAIWEMATGHRIAWMSFDPARSNKDAALLARLKSLASAATYWWWMPDGTTKEVRIPIEHWRQVYVRTLHDPDRGICIQTTSNGKPKIYLGREGIRRWIEDGK